MFHVINSITNAVIIGIMIIIRIIEIIIKLARVVPTRNTRKSDWTESHNFSRASKLIVPALTQLLMMIVSKIEYPIRSRFPTAFKYSYSVFVCSLPRWLPSAVPAAEARDRCFNTWLFGFVSWPDRTEWPELSERNKTEGNYLRRQRGNRPNFSFHH